MSHFFLIFFFQVVGGSSPPCLTFFLFSFSFFLRRHKSLRRRILRVSNEPCTDKNGARRCEPCSQADGHIFGRIRRMPRQRANVVREPVGMANCVGVPHPVPLRACSQAEVLRIGCIRRMPRQFNIIISMQLWRNWQTRQI